jgi:hypothetical protein
VSFIQKILREVHCPRCNAIAQERLEDRDKTVIIVLWCNKCKLKKNLGITTRKALKLRKRHNALREKVNQVRNPRTKAILNRRLQNLEREISKSELGI